VFQGSDDGVVDELYIPLDDADDGDGCLHIGPSMAASQLKLGSILRGLVVDTETRKERYRRSRTCVVIEGSKHHDIIKTRSPTPTLCLLRCTIRPQLENSLLTTTRLDVP
jgi:hypothetical protein